MPLNSSRHFEEVSGSWIGEPHSAQNRLPARLGWPQSEQKNPRRSWTGP